MLKTAQGHYPDCSPDGPVVSLHALVPLLHRAEGFAEVVAALKRGESGTIDGAWGSACALTVAALAQQAPHTLVVVLPRIGDVDEFTDDLNHFLQSVPDAQAGNERGATDGRGFPLVFPAWESSVREREISDAVFGGRLRVLETLEKSRERRAESREPEDRPRSGAAGSPLLALRSPLIVTSLPALLQPVPSREERRQSTRLLRVGEELASEELLRWLVECGFERTPAVEIPGEFAVHGGILDVYPPNAADPIRVELFGDEIESLRRFDAETQRTVEELDEVRLTLVKPVGDSDPSSLVGEGRSGGAEGGRTPPRKPSPVKGEGFNRDHAESSTESLLDSLPADSWIVLSELQELREEGQHYLERLREPSPSAPLPRGEGSGVRGHFSVESALAGCTQFPTVTVAALSADSMETSCHLRIESIERFTGPRNEVLRELASVVDRDEQVLIACHNEGERQRLTEMLAETETPIGEGVSLCVGRVGHGFRMVTEKLVVLSDHELFGRTELPRVRRRKRWETRAIDSFLELKPGDLVVHLTHGIGRFRGMELLGKNDQTGDSPGSQALPGNPPAFPGRAWERGATEHLVLEFRDGVRVYVPASLIHLVQKYVGASKAAPNLSKVGGRQWVKTKQKVAAAVTDLAGDMLRLQAEREAKPGLAFPPDSHWQREFEASFPYTETDDQVASIMAVKEDMQRSRPMDRLICGDVGYGKTEVAMRAAFKAIETGKQVAILVPTTVLAEQHFRTFSERMAEYPVTLEVLSRFRSKAEQRQILERMESGGVDLVIGTHRLVQRDVRFKDLGLLIIDEEQRFGVEAKETLKKLRLEVDVLTMSATPIPRTLHMALLGIRDISNLETPPHDRQSIVTRICRFDGELIRSAIIRELNRGGQVFFVHNRVYNIHSVADRVQGIVPEARLGIAHGQMPGEALERAMFDFVTGRTDVLVCTTIIESGLDIPTANTMFIHQADRFGLADLHQLRGRVGRYKHRAYCYLMPGEERTLTPSAAKRLKAIEEFSELGAGFKIAMRDLEIRGAGNILGTEQSGHISAVGYELYCRLLENAVRALKREPIREPWHVAVDLPVSAYLPTSFIPAGRQKIEVYRKFSRVQSSEELRELQRELGDRFGPLPAEVQRMIELKELQLAARRWHIDDVHLEDGFVVFGYRNPAAIRQLADTCGQPLRIVDQRSAYLPLPKNQRGPDDILSRLKSVLQGE